MEQGHLDLISHYSATEIQEEFVDCCWLANESDGYLAILLASGNIELLSLSYSSIISCINLPKSIKISSILRFKFVVNFNFYFFLEIFADSTDGERLFGLDTNSDTLHIFSFDAAVESPLIDCQTLENSFIYDSNGHLLEVTGDRLKMRPLISEEITDEEQTVDGPLLEISKGGKIEFASTRITRTNSETAKSYDNFIIDQNGRVFYLHNEATPKIPSSVWNRRSTVTHDGDNLILILCKDGNLALFDLDLNDFSVFNGALRNSVDSNAATCVFLSPAACCSQGNVKRVLVCDDSGLLCIYRIVK